MLISCLLTCEENQLVKMVNIHSYDLTVSCSSDESFVFS